MNTTIKLDETQYSKLEYAESGTSFRLRLGQHRLSEFVAWVFMVMPAIAPLPNLFNLTYAISHNLGNTWGSLVTAFLICLTIELMLIGVSEQLNGVIDKWLRAHEGDKHLYYVPAAITGTGSLLIVAIMLGLVYHYEVRSTGNYTALTLPFISVLSVAFMGVRSYMVVVENVKRDERGAELNAEHELNATLNAELNMLREHMTKQGGELVQYTEELQKLKIERDGLKSELLVEHERSHMFEHQLNTQPARRSTRGNPQTAERRNALFIMLSNEYDGASPSEINKSELAERLDTSHTTISRDLKALESSGRLSLNGSVKVIE